MYRAILVYVDDTEASTFRVTLAASLAREFKSFLIGFAAGLPRLPIEIYDASIGTLGLGPDPKTLDRSEVQTGFNKLGEAFAVATQGLETEWRTAFEAPSIALADVAVLADLIVVGPGNTSLLGDMRSVEAGDVVLNSGRPVLVVPEGVGALEPGHVLIAWKNTMQAQRAITDALPFLKRAARVTLAEVRKASEQGTTLEEPLAYLAHHGVTAAPVTLRHESGDVETAILAHAREHGAGLIVAGAYGHTRLREWVFGGVTRGLLTGAGIPCLFSN